MTARTLLPLAGILPVLAVAAQGPPASVAKALQSVGLIHAETGPGQFQQGSGVVLSRDYVATNAHVVRNAYRIQVQKGDLAWEAEALCLVPDRDLVLLKDPVRPAAPASP